MTILSLHCIVLAAILLASTPIACCFVLLSPSRARSRISFLHAAAAADSHQSTTSEYSVLDTKQRVEYAALSPGCAVEIQVGNVTLARKAWKKRRRSTSPVLVPCSILGVDTKNMVEWNIIYLVEKFGTPLSEIQSEELGFMSDDVCLSMSEISKYYSSHLGTSLAKHAKALGHDTARSLVRDVFNRQTQKDLGVRLWLPPKDNYSAAEEKEEDDRPMWLMVPLSKQRAHRMASQAGLLQFTSSANNTTDTTPDGNDDQNDNIRLQHTGFLRVRNKKKHRKAPPHLFVPLSAALRVSQRAVDQGIIANGSNHSAVVFSLDQMGDGGSPLMTLCLNPTRGHVRNRLKLKAAGKRHFAKDKRVEIVGQVSRDLKDLRVGDGPIKAKVMRLSTRSGAAFVDCSVGRTAKDGGSTRVLGMLRFDDLVQSALTRDESMNVEFSSTMSEEEAQLIEDVMQDEDEDWEEDDDDAMTVEDLFFAKNDDDEISDEDEDDDVDITDLLTVDEDGVVSYEDPETGKKVIVSEFDVGSPSDDEEEDTDSMFTGLSTQERLDLLTKVVSDLDEQEEEIEEEIDITSLVSTKDGVMSYKDPETGETIVISDSSIEEEDEDLDQDDDDEDGDDLFKNMSPEERLEMISNIMNDREVDAGSSIDDDDSDQFEDEEEVQEETSTVPGTSTTTISSFDAYTPAFVQVGDEVEVYIKAVYKQSGRFMVTLDPSVQGRKAKEMKKESETEKKLARLAEKMGGLERIKGLEGTECDGVVQALSNTGDWCYVKPSIDDLPVGVAKLASEEIVSKGDAVRVRMDGIDESRGQLAMTVI